MSESEKRLREWLKTHPGLSDVTRKNRLDELDTLLAEHRAEVAAARDAALEEVCRGLAKQADTAERGRDSADVSDVLNATHDWVWALRSQPAQSIPVAKVRDALREARRASADMLEADEQDILRRLGVPLDAEPEHGSKCQSTLKDCNGVSTRACGRCDSCCGYARGICAAPESERCEGWPDCGWHNGGLCRVCKAKQGEPHKMSCRPENREATAMRDTRRECTCTGSCRGPEGLGDGWKCALGKEKSNE